MLRCPCPQCRHVLVLHESKAGVILPCPACSFAFQIPPQRGDHPPESVDDTVLIQIQCPHCSYALMVDETKAGSLTRCSTCARPFRIPLSLPLDDRPSVEGDNRGPSRRDRWRR